MASHGLKEEDLNAFCRAQGVFPHHLKKLSCKTISIKINDFLLKARKCHTKAT